MLMAALGIAGYALSLLGQELLEDGLSHDFSHDCCQGWEDAGTACSRNHLVTARALSALCPLVVCSRCGEGETWVWQGCVLA